jgi:hypothetical protein
MEMSKQPLAIHNVQQGFDYYTVSLFSPIPGLEAELDFQRISDGDNGAIWCEMSVSVIANDARTRLVQPSRTNLMNSTKSSAGWKAHLETLNELASEIHWQDVLGDVVGMAADAYRNGHTATRLDLDGVERRPPWLLEPFIASSGVSVFFGEGGVGKSLIGLAAAASVACEDHTILGTWAHKKGPVIYFDYEDDDAIHNERLHALARSHNIPRLDHDISHYSLVAKVSSAQAQMRRIVRESGAVLVVLDSIGMGRGGDAGGAEDTIRLFRALRSLGVPTLALDHVTKEDKRRGSNLTPYGSIYTVNSARLLWGARMSSASTALTRYINLENTKANHVPRQKNIGLQIDYSPDDHGQLAGVKIKSHDEWWDDEDEEVATAVEEIRKMTDMPFVEEDSEGDL